MLLGAKGEFKKKFKSYLTHFRPRRARGICLGKVALLLAKWAPFTDRNKFAADAVISSCKSQRSWERWGLS
jgi:hypothetical protein